MGITNNVIPAVIDCVSYHGLSGSLLMLGRQRIFADKEMLMRILADASLAPKLAPEKWKTENGKITPESTFGALGFSGVESLDISDIEGADHIVDLNGSETPSHLNGRFDVIFDGGTLEHIFHLPNALARCAEMLKKDGTLIHNGPMNNWADHGFYQFSPTLWFDWFVANNWTVRESVMIRLAHKPASGNWDEGGEWRFDPLPPGCLGARRQLDDHPYLMLMAAQKSTASTWHATPMQSMYAQRYHGSSPVHHIRTFEPYTVTRGIRSTKRRNLFSRIRDFSAGRMPLLNYSILR